MNYWEMNLPRTPEPPGKTGRTNRRNTSPNEWKGRTMLNWKSIPPLGGVLESLDPNRSIAIHLGREIICGTAGSYVEENRLRPILMKKAIKRHDEDTLFIHTTHVWVV